MSRPHFRVEDKGFCENLENNQYFCFPNQTYTNASI